MDSSRTLAHKPTASSFTIRHYRHPDDLDRIRSMFVQSSLHRPDAPYKVAVSRFASHTRGAHGLFAVGVVCLCMLSVKTPDISVFTRIGEESPVLIWIAAAITVVSALASVYFWRYRRTVRSMFEAYVKECLDKDFNDVRTMFGLKSLGGSLECSPHGPSGFWIAEEDDEIIGFVGLLTGISEEANAGDVRRLVVSPSHRRRGVAGKLMEVLVNHARANGIVALELTTSDFHIGALKLYEKCGWKLKRRWLYVGVLLHILRKEI